ncbi:YtxH domain-containing protein [Vagococcus elongatus]|uniref:Gas vesicle protein n=1 Tax=Vagococcus elongatus TaxID=180344 RepID=A0A430AMP1_9ENTE|nr:YtxH domain-containing protein [Vagococcus elongatus]RSU09174.1 hypothetical protein CBF29_11945 [Vagococcus elongatus]
MLKNFTKGLLVGSVIGGALGLLFAPQSGKKSRQKMIDDVEDTTRLVDELQEGLDNFNRSLGNLKQTAGETLPNFQKEMSQTLRKFQFQAEPRLKEIENTVETLNQHLSTEKDQH